MNLQLFGLFPPGFDAPNPLSLDTPAGDPPALQDIPAAEPTAPVEAPAAPAATAVEAPAPALDMDALVAKLTESIGSVMQTPAPAAEPAVSEPTPEELEELNSKMRDEFLDNPKAFLDKITASIRADAEASVLEQVAPVLEREKAMQRGQELQSIVDEFKGRTPDFDNHRDAMGQYLSENEGLDNHPNALQIAYDAVKGRQTQDPEALKQQVLSDPAVKESIIKQYLEEIKNGQPPVIVSGTGNLGMPTVPQKPTDVKGASALFMQSMRAKGL
jgi:hypothetical protein